MKKFIADHFGFEKIITQPPQMQHAIELAAKEADIPNAAVTIFGESGIGKELLARAIHHNAGFAGSRFVGVNCAAIPARSKSTANSFTDS